MSKIELDLAKLPTDTMKKVIALSAKAYANHARAIGLALDCLVSSAVDPERRKNASIALRVALIAQSEGYEPTSGNGSTHKARVEAAKEALYEWDTSNTNGYE